MYVKANKNEKWGSECPDEFNLGLSFIDKKRGLVVPKYCRCQMAYENTLKPNVIFDYLEISDAGIAIIKEYMKQLPEVVDAIDHEFKKYKNFKFLTPEKMFLKKPDNDNLELIKLYINLYKLDARGHFYRIYSKRSVTAPKYSADDMRSSLTVDIEPTHCMSKRLVRILPLPYLRREP